MVSSSLPRRLVVVAMALGVVALVALPSMVAAESRFRKKIDFKALEENWSEDDEEDEEWHEDNFEWKEKERQERQANFKFDPKDPSSVSQLMANQNGGSMQMAFAKLKNAESKKETEELAGKWQALLSTDAVKVMVYAIEDDSILLTNDEGHMPKIMRFCLDQPEVEKFTWSSQDYYPDTEEGAALKVKDKEEKAKKAEEAKKKREEREAKKKRREARKAKRKKAKRRAAKKARKAKKAAAEKGAAAAGKDGEL